MSGARGRATKGKTWTDLESTGLPNPSSGTDAVTLADGRQLLVYNHRQRPSGRCADGRLARRLNVAVSDDGKNWQAALVLEDDGEEYSYPAVIQTDDGLVHITYTWHRKRVKHVIVDPAKLKLTPIVDGKWPAAVRAMRLMLSSVDLLVLVGYLVAVVGIGLWLGRHGSSPDEYMAARRSLPGWAVGLSMFGSYVSSISFLANPGKAYAANWNPLVFSLATPIAAAVAVRWFMPFYRHTRRDFGVRAFRAALRALGADVCGRLLSALSDGADGDGDLSARAGGRAAHGLAGRDDDRRDGRADDGLHAGRRHQGGGVDRRAAKRGAGGGDAAVPGGDHFQDAGRNQRDRDDGRGRATSFRSAVSGCRSPSRRFG